jgi:RNA polymerase sigma factor (sigma-70 family)
MMQESLAQTRQDRPASPLQPLQTEGRTREPHVEAQIESLLRASSEAFWQRARQQDRALPDWVQEEALVGILRIWNRRGDGEAAWKIAELLIERSARFVSQHIQCWPQLGPQHVEECIRDVQIQMLADLFNDGRGCEFWEVRFWLCLKRRLLNIVQKYRAVAEAERVPAPIEDDEGHTTDYFDRVAAPEGLSVQHRTEIREALALLTEQERIAFVLYHYEDWPQQEIAAHLKVTDRTVRNLLGRAEKRLELWRTANMQ